jgi:hypothetical protein
MNDLLTIEALQQAIALVAADKLDYKKIVVQLAQYYPEIFVKLTANVVPQQWQREVKRKLFQSGCRVDGIRLLRTRTGIGLKEALDVCHTVENMMFVQGRGTEYHDFPDGFVLSSDLKNLAELIANAD